ncbi:MAG: hypothetical protein Q9224_005745, partial [Gallowayella concinna]
MAPTITSQQWDERKEEILRLYIGDGLALKPVMRAMRSERFDPTESQYRTRLKKWQRRKPRNRRQPAPVVESVTSKSPVASNETGQGPRTQHALTS